MNHATRISLAMLSRSMRARAKRPPPGCPLFQEMVNWVGRCVEPGVEELILFIFSFHLWRVQYMHERAKSVELYWDLSKHTAAASSRAWFSATTLAAQHQRDADATRGIHATTCFSRVRACGHLLVSIKKDGVRL